MSDTTASLRHKISRATNLQSVVRTMKAVAASSISQYENSVRALDDYYHAVELGLSVCIRSTHLAGAAESMEHRTRSIAGPTTAVIFGSDQGLVGQFNDVISDHAVQMLMKQSRPVEVWAVGERVRTRLVDAKMTVKGNFSVPSSIKAITALVGQILLETRSQQFSNDARELYIIHNHPTSGASYAPISQRLLPLDVQWRESLARRPWPTNKLPEVLGHSKSALQAFVHEYLFVSIFRACAESLASENASRLAAMQRADKNIDELLGDLNGTFHSVRQGGIDDELFDVISSFEALSADARPLRAN